VHGFFYLFRGFEGVIIAHPIGERGGWEQYGVAIYIFFSGLI
jgi:hypothetical protein